MTRKKITKKLFLIRELKDYLQNYKIINEKKHRNFSLSSKTLKINKISKKD
jgi:hypothetical protein